MKISVIVPVYNAEKYVSKCIESVLSQTYSDWELWLVDDGSQDDSLSILNNYAQKDSRINVIHQENGGAGMARNAAIQRVSGDYIVFIDSDDYVIKEYFSLIVQKNTDVVFIDDNLCEENGKIIKIERLSKYNTCNKEDIIRHQMTGNMPWGGWRKAVKTHIVKDNHILYSSHKVGEESVYSFLVLYYANNFSFIDFPVYNYVQHFDSLSHTPLDDPWGKVAINLKNKIVELGLYEAYASTLNAFFVRAAVGSLYELTKKYPYQEYNLRANERIALMKSFVDRQYEVDVKHLDERARIMYPLLKMNFVSAIYAICRIRSFF